MILKRFSFFVYAAAVAVVFCAPGSANSKDKFVKPIVPLAFELDTGQAEPSALYISRSPRGILFLTSTGAVIRSAQLQRSFSMQLIGASPQLTVRGSGALSGRVNYFRGNDPALWRTDIPTYSKVEYQSAYHGIDVIFYGREGQLEYDFVVAPHSLPKQIALQFGGISGDGHIDSNGDFVAKLFSGDMRLQRPLAYQVDPNGGRRIIACRFVDAYVTGATLARPIQSKNSGGMDDVFVSKLGNTGSELLYSTYLGGAGWDVAVRVAVDLFGSASVVGFTTSQDYPVYNAVQAKFAGGFSDAFVSKLSPDGTHFVYSTYLGGSGDEYGYAIDSGLLGAVWVGGSTSSRDYPVKDAYQPKYAGVPSTHFCRALNLHFAKSLTYSLSSLTKHATGMHILRFSGMCA